MKTTTQSIIYTTGFWTVISTALVSHTKIPIPPALFIFGLSVLIMFVLFFTGNRYRKVPVYALCVLPLSAVLLLSQPFTNASVQNFVGPLISALYFFVTAYYMQFLSGQEIMKIIKNLLVLSLVILTAEEVYRFIFPNYYIADVASRRIDQEGMFYMFKTDSIMYKDSNGAAIHILIVLFFTYYWGEIIGRKYKIIKIILIILIGLTISRAAWFGTLAGIVYFRFLRGKSVSFWVSAGIATIIIASILTFTIIIPMVEEDKSFMSKFEIANLVIEYYEQSPPINEQLIGVGVYQSQKVFGIYAHSFLMVQMIEMGIVSTILLLAMWGYFIYYTKSKALIILIPFFITTLSSTLSFMPIFYVSMALMCEIERRKEEFTNMIN